MPESQRQRLALLALVPFVAACGSSLKTQGPVVTPTWVDRSNGFLIRPVLTDLADPSVDAATKDQLYRSLQRTGSVVGAYITG